MPQERKTAEVTAILDLIEVLDTKVRLDGSLSYISEDQFDKLIEGVNKLTINIYNHKEVSQRSQNRLEELTDIITSMASLDFSRKAYVGEDYNHLDYIAIGLNLLSYQLEKQLKPLIYYKNLISVTEEPIIITDFDYTILNINPAAEKLIGLTEPSVVNSPLINFISNFDNLRPNGESTRVQLDINKNDVASKHLFEVYSIRDQNSTQNGWAFVCIDRIIANTNLSDLSKKYDVDLNRIQHDMMSPVRNIHGLTELGQMTDNCEEKIKYFAVIEKCIKSVEIHIKDLFNMLTINDNKDKKQLIHFSEIIENQLAELNYLPGFSSIKISLDISNAKPFHSVHRLVSSIFHNLLSNAIKYKRGNATPQVNISVRDIDNGISIEVKDNGIGIKEEYLQEIFKPHYRATEQSEGKGLGLYILGEAIRELGGNITVESQFGAGSSFNVYLPYMK